MLSWHHAAMGNQRPMRDPHELADRSATVGDAGGENLDGRAVGSFEAEIERVRGEDDFAARAKRLLERDREILDRLAE